MGKVLDVYWHFSEPGDHYLGRILSGLDPTKPEFDCLPPHFTVVDPMENCHVKKAMNLLYGPILVAHGGKQNDPTALLLRGLACIIHHMVDIMKVMIKNPGHAFVSIPLFNDTKLIDELREIVTIEETNGVVSMSTGIPPHVTMAVEMKSLLKKCGSIFEAVSE